MIHISDPQLYKRYMKLVEQLKVDQPEEYQKLLDHCGVEDADLAEYVRTTFQTKEEK